MGYTLMLYILLNSFFSSASSPCHQNEAFSSFVFPFLSLKGKPHT